MMQIREIIARAIQEADDGRCPEGYADRAGYGDHDWISDWGAFLADRVRADLLQTGFAIVPRAPTEAMLAAGDSTMPQIAAGEDVTTGRDALSEAWPAMLDAFDAQ
jgi:hypothetical protein